MKKSALLATLFLVLFVGLSSTLTDYDTIDPLSLPEFSGDLSEVEYEVRYEDSKGEYIYIEIDGKLYILYL
jgi:hypothetical protein